MYSLLFCPNDNHSNSGTCNIVYSNSFIGFAIANFPLFFNTAKITLLRKYLELKGVKFLPMNVVTYDKHTYHLQYANYKQHDDLNVLQKVELLRKPVGIKANNNLHDNYTLVKYSNFVMDDVIYNMIVISQQIYNFVITIEQAENQFPQFTIHDTSYDVSVECVVDNVNIEVVSSDKVMSSDKVIHIAVDNSIQYSITSNDIYMPGLVEPNQNTNWISFGKYIDNVPDDDVHYFKLNVEDTHNENGVDYSTLFVKFHIISTNFLHVVNE